MSERDGSLLKCPHCQGTSERHHMLTGEPMPCGCVPTAVCGFCGMRSTLGDTCEVCGKVLFIHGYGSKIELVRNLHVIDGGKDK